MYTKKFGHISAILLFCVSLLTTRCTETPVEPPIEVPTQSEVLPVDINVEGFDFLEQMQGHWVGMNRVIATDYDWFTFDYRAISPSHIHGIYEGGTVGNLFTSFFVTNFKDTRTIMARNGGILNGIYRTSYFVLDSVNISNDESFYRLVDAHGGQAIMSMELRFVQDSLFFNSYTSRIGVAVPPTRHMTFKAKKRDLELSQAAANAVGFPQNVVERDFAAGFDLNDLWIDEGQSAPLSATVFEYEKDPFTIDEHPYLSYLEVTATRNPQIQDSHLLFWLSKTSLTDSNGYLTYDYDAYDTVLMFPTIINEDTFTFSYLHPGTYYLNVVADQDQDGAPSVGDITAPSQLITITPESLQNIVVDNINIQN